ncbi:MAG: acetyl-CoA carboxylase carboxyl transferase subunit beta, partial [Myxococcota bacterium]
MTIPEKTRASTPGDQKITLGAGVLRRCDGCGETFRSEEFKQAWETCPSCGRHFKLGAAGWLELLIDEGSWQEHDADLSSGDPLGFVDSKRYPDRVTASQAKSGHTDAMMCGSAKLHGRDVQLGLFLFRFMGGS